MVSRQEFRNIIRSRCIPLTEVDLEDLILALDRDNSDALDYRELAVGRQSYLEQRFVTLVLLKLLAEVLIHESHAFELLIEEKFEACDPPIFFLFF